MAPNVRPLPDGAGEEILLPSNRVHSNPVSGERIRAGRLSPEEVAASATDLVLVASSKGFPVCCVVVQTALIAKVTLDDSRTSTWWRTRRSALPRVARRFQRVAASILTALRGKRFADFPRLLSWLVQLTFARNVNRLLASNL